MAEKQAVKNNVYDLSVLRRKCKELFGVSKTVFDGATAELETEKRYTICDIKGIIEKWLKKEV